jgi:hypothetical protein
MAMPEFTGDASLYNTSIQYHASIGVQRQRAESVISQQLSFILGGPYSCREVCSPCTHGYQWCRFVGPGLCPQIIWLRPCFWF